MTLAAEPLLTALAAVVGTDRVLTDPSDLAPYETDWRGHFKGKALCAVLPGSTAEVAETVRLCAEAGIAVVPQGGRTGLVGGGVPNDTGTAVVLNLARMNKVRSLDAMAMTIAVDAGITLAAARQHAATAQLNLPILIGSEGSAQIGGVIGTNAGGSNVLRYGMTRNLVMGLEVVLPDGRIWNGMRALTKDNTGYALRHLFIGSEGTLGIVTGAVLQLAPEPQRTTTAFCPVIDISSALSLLDSLRRAHFDALVAFEYISAATVALIAKYRPELASTLSVTTETGDCLLIEFAHMRASEEADAAIEADLGNAFENGWLTDALIASSETQRKAMWAFREAISFAQNDAGYSVKNDVSVPVARIPDLLRDATAAVAAVTPMAQPICYGHLGDGNIHFNFSPATPEVSGELRALEPAIVAALNGVVQSLDGSFSAEHGIGQAKVETLAKFRAGMELELMRAIKTLLDPHNTMNPGKVV